MPLTTELPPTCRSVDGVPTTDSAAMQPVWAPPVTCALKMPPEFCVTWKVNEALLQAARTFVPVRTR